MRQCTHLKRRWSSIRRNWSPYPKALFHQPTRKLRTAEIHTRLDRFIHIGESKVEGGVLGKANEFRFHTGCHRRMIWPAGYNKTQKTVVEWSTQRTFRERFFSEPALPKSFEPDGTVKSTYKNRDIVRTIAFSCWPCHNMPKWGVAKPFISLKVCPSCLFSHNSFSLALYLVSEPCLSPRIEHLPITLSPVPVRYI